MSGAPKNPALFIFTCHGGNSGNPSVTIHSSVLRLSTDAAFKRDVVLWQFKAAFEWLMSYLIQELTNWWPLLSIRMDCDLGEGNNRIVHVCVWRKRRDDTCCGS